MELINQLIESARSYGLDDLYRGLVIIPLVLIGARLRQRSLENYFYEQDVKLSEERAKYEDRGEQ